ncbi:hypothetical protein CBR_g23962 [Chara braunii]|uniref:Uncharacterized protein n=1 Tax=Chara braunii TaxID=69332 RepID=A0A388L5I4_CHABU|nr:hypothetical protein CBR_g23962 [Chara braunii]|eukprot:GBG77518.1 hypothetical protein CBR_g23962 [Chara braunii]
MNARKESELEVERLKESLARLEMERRTTSRGTNLKTRLDDAATNKDKENGVVNNDVGTSLRKNKDKEPNVVSNLVDRHAFVRANRKDLRARNKEFVMKVCEQEGVEYTTLDLTKEAIVQARAAKVFDDDGGRGKKGKEAVTMSISNDVAGCATTGDRDDSAAS